MEDPTTKQFVTRYCVVCGGKVTQGPEATAADARVRCEECRSPSASPGRPTLPALLLTPMATSTHDRRQNSPRGHASASSVPHSWALPAAGAGLIVLAVAVLWITSPDRQSDAPPQAAPIVEMRPHPASDSEGHRKDGPPPSCLGVEKGEGMAIAVANAPGPPVSTPPCERGATPGALSADAPGPLSTSDGPALRAARGSTRTVRGIVARASLSRTGKVFRISFDCGDDGFEAVIFQRELPEFEARFGDLARALPGRDVCVRGRISIYQGRVQIVLEEPSQLELR